MILLLGMGGIIPDDLKAQGGEQMTRTLAHVLGKLLPVQLLGEQRQLVFRGYAMLHRLSS
jgi:hypothetical protein